MLCTSRRLMQTRVKDEAEARQKSLLDRKRAIKRPERPYLARAACEAASDTAWGRIGARGSFKRVRESARDVLRLVRSSSECDEMTAELVIHCGVKYLTFQWKLLACLSALDCLSTSATFTQLYRLYRNWGNVKWKILNYWIHWIT